MFQLTNSELELELKNVHSLNTPNCFELDILALFMFTDLILNSSVIQYVCHLLLFLRCFSNIYYSVKLALRYSHSFSFVALLGFAYFCVDLFNGCFSQLRLDHDPAAIDENLVLILAKECQASKRPSPWQKYYYKSLNMIQILPNKLA